MTGILAQPLKVVLKRSWTAVLIMFTGMALIGVVSVASAHEGATGVVKERMDRFKASKTSLQTIKQALKTEDWTVLQTEAEQLNVWANEMVEYFPEGSNQAPSEARDAVWLDWDGFVQAVQAFGVTTRGLVSAADNRSVNEASLAFKATAQSCKACHDSFRKE
jgi:cytochrome c556